MGGTYAEDHMRFVVMGADSDSEETLHGAEADADALFEAGSSCTEVDVGGEAIVPSTTACYLLHFNSSLETSTYDIDVSGADHIVIFTEHSPAEFEADTHYLLTADGDAVEASHELPADEEDDDAGDDAHAGHDHGGGADEDDHQWEWAGVFDVLADSAVQWVGSRERLRDEEFRRVLWTCFVS